MNEIHVSQWTYNKTEIPNAGPLSPKQEIIAAPPPTPTPAPCTPAPRTSMKRVITTRQFIFMALSSSVGAGLLLSTGQALAVGGPIPLFLAFLIVGLAVWITMCALGELSTNFPVNSGSFCEYSVRFISPSWGFAMGWNYVMEFIFIVPFEIIVMIMCARFWDPEINAAYLVPVFILALVVIYAFGARWYAEAENLFGACKMTILTIFVVTAMLIVTRRMPTDTRLETELAYHSWRTEGFRNGLGGFLFVFMSAGMAYGGTEMLGLTAAECRSPRYVMGLASKLVAGRITFLYLLPILMLGLVLNTDPTTLNQDSTDITPRTVATASPQLISPFVQAVSQAQIPILPDIINAVIVVSIFSMANASTFAASRALQAISARGMGPRFCAVLWRGRPIGALGVVFAFSFLAFAKAGANGDEVFVWLLALASCCNYLTWSSICVAHMRCRLAVRRQKSRGRQIQIGNIDYEAYRSPFGIPGSVFAVGIFLFGLCAQIVAAVRSPLPTPPPVASSFLGLIVVIIFWVGYMIWKRDFTLLIPLDSIEVGPKQGLFSTPTVELVEFVKSV